MSNAIAVKWFSYGACLKISEIIHGINDIVVTSFNNESKKHKTKIYYNMQGRAYFRLYNNRFYIDEFIRI
jgi:hypothetical protein